MSAVAIACSMGSVAGAEHRFFYNVTAFCFPKPFLKRASRCIGPQVLLPVISVAKLMGMVI